MFLELRLANPKEAHSASRLFWKAKCFYGGGSPPAAPAPPPAPNYTEASRAGIFTDVDSLASRRAIDQAAFFGKSAMKYGYEKMGEDLTKSGYTKERNGSYTKMVDQLRAGIIDVGGQYYTEATPSQALSRNGQLNKGFSKTDDGKFYRGNAIPRKNAVAQVKQVVDKAEATTPNSYYVRKYDENGKALSSPVRVSEQEAVANFEGQGTLDASESAAAWQREQAQLNAKFGLDMAETFGEDYVNVAKRTMEQLDPEGTKARKDLGALVGEDFLDARGLGPRLFDYGSAESMQRLSQDDRPTFQYAEQARGMERLGDAKRMERVSNAKDMERVSNAKSKELVSGSGPSLKRGTATDGGGFGASARSGMEAQLLKELSGEGELSDVEKSNLEQNVRAAQVARGNYGGGSAEFQEAFGKTGAVERRKRENRGELLNYLSSGQSSFDVANRLRGEDNALSQTEFGNLLSAITQRNDASQSDFENLLAAGNQRNEASQLDFNNLLSASNQRNAANQADFSNDALSMGQRNAASQADFENQLNLVQQNNATQQQNFSNIGSVIDQNNRAAQIDTENRNNQTSLQNSVEMQDYQNRLTELNSINAARQQQISNLGSFTSGTPMGQVAAMNAGAQALPVPISGSNILNFMGVNPNAGQAGADFALGVFGQQGANYRAGLDYSQNMYRTNQAYNSPLSWFSAIGQANPVGFSFGG